MSVKGKKILIVTGEASGDFHGSKVARALKELSPDVKIFAMGSEKLRLAGAEIVVDSSSLAVVGITEVFARLRTILRALADLKSFLRREKPELALLIDFPDFNMRLARTAKKLGVPVLYYIGPQVWAWRSGRVQALARVVQKMAVIFPFEVPFYESAGVPVEFVGHPLMDVLNGWEAGKKEFSGDPVVTLLPGSRAKEVSSLLPAMIQAAEILKEKKPQARFLLPLAPTIGREEIERLLGDFPALTIVEGKTYKAISAADLAIVASGTATLETALLGKPMVIVYRVSAPTYWIGRMLIRVKCIGLANIVAGRKIVPELIQKDACGEKIAAEALKILTDSNYRKTMAAELSALRGKMGNAGTATRVAQIALELAGSPPNHS